jgi:hypothetical protein
VGELEERPLARQSVILKLILINIGWKGANFEILTAVFLVRI